MKTVHKFRLTETGRNTVVLPIGAKVLHVGMQAGVPCIWAYVDTTQPLEERSVYVFGTGWEMSDVPEMPTYHGTAHTDDSLVWHVFELPRS
jgi:hypothetical protein